MYIHTYIYIYTHVLDCIYIYIYICRYLHIYNIYNGGNGSNYVNDGYGVVDGSVNFHDKWTSADFFGSYFVGLWYFDNLNLLGEFFYSSF